MLYHVTSTMAPLLQNGEISSAKFGSLRSDMLVPQCILGLYLPQIDRDPFLSLAQFCWRLKAVRFEELIGTSATVRL